MRPSLSFVQPSAAEAPPGLSAVASTEPLTTFITMPTAEQQGNVFVFGVQTPNAANFSSWFEAKRVCVHSGVLATLPVTLVVRQPSKESRNGILKTLFPQREGSASNLRTLAYANSAQRHECGPRVPQPAAGAHTKAAKVDATRRERRNIKKERQKVGRSHGKAHVEEEKRRNAALITGGNVDLCRFPEKQPLSCWKQAGHTHTHTQMVQVFPDWGGS